MRTQIEPVATATTTREATFALLRKLGMTTVFGNPGSTELRFLKDWPSDFQYVTALHEQGAVSMADAYAQIRRNAAFINLHSAGGLGDAMGAIFTAYKNQTPLVITAGQQTRAMLPTAPFLYAEDPTAFPRPYVKWSYEPSRGQDVPEAIAHAYYIAMQRPYGPVFVSIPEDDWDRVAEPVEPRQLHAEFCGDAHALDDLARALARAKHPAIVVGPAVDRDDAGDLAVRLAEVTRAAVWVSPFSSRCSFPERHPQFTGFLPPVRASIARMLGDYDLVVVLGAPVFTFHVFTEGPFVAPGTELVQLSDDPSEVAAAGIGTSIVTTMRPALERILAMLDASDATRPNPPGRKLPPRLAPSEPIAGAFAMQALADTLPEDAIVLEETPSHRNVLHDHLPITKPGGFFAAASGSLGWALPAAVGAALAAPGRRIVALVGDGSSLYSIQGLWTAARLQLPITFVILNNRAYGAMNEFSRYLRFEGAPSFDLRGCDFVALGQGFGVTGTRVERGHHRRPALPRSCAAAGPALTEVRVDDTVGVIY